MIKGSETRRGDHGVDLLFVDRWSPREMTGEAIAREDLMALLEAARWAPSSYNDQPWRILYAGRESRHWPTFFDLLDEGNRAWAKDAAVLLVVTSRTTHARNGKPSRTHSLDTGAAWENLALAGSLRGLAVHGLEGFDYARAREALAIPEGFAVEMMVAIGRARDARETETPSDRLPVEEIAFEGAFPAGVAARERREGSREAAGQASSKPRYPAAATLLISR